MEKKIYVAIWPHSGIGINILDMTKDAITLNDLKKTTNNAASFLRQGKNDSYVDKWDVIHEVTAHEDKPFAWYFEVIDDCWEEVLGRAGALLDDSENKDMPEETRKGFEKIYEYAYNHVFPNLDLETRR